MVVYKTRNTGTCNGMRGTRGMGGSYIPGNVAKHWGQCRQTFQGMSLNIPGNVLKLLRECCQAFQGMSPNILRNPCVTQGICSRRLITVKQLRLDQTKKTYLWWFRNPAFGDWTGSNRNKKEQVCVPPRFVWW